MQAGCLGAVERQDVVIGSIGAEEELVAVFVDGFQAPAIVVELGLIAQILRAESHVGKLRDGDHMAPSVRPGGAPLVWVRLHDAWLAVWIGNLLHFGRVLDRVALGVVVVGEQVIAEQMSTRSPGARDTTLPA